jgi:hypothetical protein
MNGIFAVGWHARRLTGVFGLSVGKNHYRKDFALVATLNASNFTAHRRGNLDAGVYLVVKENTSCENSIALFYHQFGNKSVKVAG